MHKNNIVSTIAIIVMAYSLFVMAGWVTDNVIWASVFENTVTMKFTTALSFVCAALIVILTDQSLKGRHNVALTFLPAPCLLLSLLMFSIVIALMVGIKTGVENLFVREDVDAVLTTYPGRPSVVTIFNFLLILLAGFMGMLQSNALQRYLMIIGSLILCAGSLALLGYALKVPCLYSVIEGYSTAMAINTAVLFLLIGAALMTLGGSKR